MKLATQAFVLTGGPGGGKTSIIAALAAKGFAAMPEAGRAIIQDQQRIGGKALPWADRALFAEWMLAADLRSYHQAAALDQPVAMDRGLIDVIGYLKLCGLSVPPAYEKAATLYRYHSTVFWTPFWPEIYAQDPERKQDLPEAERTAAMMAETYRSYGYEILELPRKHVAARVDFIIQNLPPPMRPIG